MTVAIIIGMGEVGRAVNQVLSTVYRTVTYDPKRDTYTPSMQSAPADDDLRVLHICFGYSDEFEESVRKYQMLFEPSYTIIHSTTPVGVSKALDCYHSPVMGIQPYLAECLTTFLTYLAPKNTELKAYLQKAGMDVKCVADSDTTEAGKLWSLTTYALSITLEKEIYNWCLDHNVDYAIAYKHFTHTYNSGYNALGLEKYTRPILEHMEGPIGGHCVLSGVEKLIDSSRLAEVIMSLQNDPTTI